MEILIELPSWLPARSGPQQELGFQTRIKLSVQLNMVVTWSSWILRSLSAHPKRELYMFRSWEYPIMWKVEGYPMDCYITRMQVKENNACDSDAHNNEKANGSTSCRRRQTTLLKSKYCISRLMPDRLATLYEELIRSQSLQKPVCWYGSVLRENNQINRAIMNFMEGILDGDGYSWDCRFIPDTALVSCQTTHRRLKSHERTEKHEIGIRKASTAPNPELALVCGVGN